MTLYCDQFDGAHQLLCKTITIMNFPMWCMIFVAVLLSWDVIDSNHAVIFVYL